METVGVGMLPFYVAVKMDTLRRLYLSEDLEGMRE